MSVRILWRSTVFVITLALIYLAFPILIVPSSLPAIQAMLIENKYPDQASTSPSAIVSQEAAGAQIYQLTIPVVPTVEEKLQLIKDLHRQGMDKILNR
ncbi:MAG: hypothetical protein UV54_C0001G0027 [Candidatus Beckwithbacteria bacterium GW2011_GWA2_43_10]|uniref:Uncharacterized protein n=1 Tax=Candidatus Beckwithbacteria bacterium GW2011_GWA2_43_10 TaxID=1618369 RepID=A0A0G1C555_9BACT|nr:MAG: hypothetical protein UV54_C0001G0027 [Candidatus Beckwithbacteria bacterium GW2011_GWA2_43_10]